MKTVYNTPYDQARHTTTDLSYSLCTIRFSTGYKIQEDPLLQATVNLLPFSIHDLMDRFGWRRHRNELTAFSE